MMYDSRGFNWLLAELDRKKNLAYGWACLNDEQNAEWGYIYLPDLEEINAVRDMNWIPIFFPEAKKLVYGFRQRPGSREHFSWWYQENQTRLKKEYQVLWKGHADLLTYVEKLYKVEFGLVK